MNYDNQSLDRGLRRGAYGRRFPTMDTGRPVRFPRVRAQYVATPANRNGRHNGVYVFDELAFYADPRKLFTDLEKSEKRFTVADAYSQAAMVIRARRNLDPDAVVFPKGSYQTTDKTPTLTMSELSDLVEDLIFQR